MKKILLRSRFLKIGSQNIKPYLHSAMRVFNMSPHHFYTTSLSESNKAKNEGYSRQIIGYVFDKKSTGMIPLFRLFNPSTGDHLYTIDSNEQKEAIQRGYISEGISCYVYTKGEGTLNVTREPLYRLYNATTQDHLYTTLAFVAEDARTRMGYQDEGIAGYIIYEIEKPEITKPIGPGPGSLPPQGLVPLYELTKDLTPPPPPPILKILIGVCNMNNPGLTALGKLSPNEPIETLKRWGNNLFSQADVVLVSELGAPGWTLRDDTYLKILSESSGLKYRHAAFGDILSDPTFPDLGILSRYPFDSTPVVHRLPDNTKLLDATILIHGHLHRFLTTHFTSKTHAPAHPNSNRIESVHIVQRLINGETKGIIFGGDFNTCPPFERDCDGDVGEGVEYLMLTNEFKDSFVEVPGAIHSNKRIDYLFYKGQYKAISYRGDYPEVMKPMDHPYIQVTLKLI